MHQHLRPGIQTRHHPGREVPVPERTLLLPNVARQPPTLHLILIPPSNCPTTVRLGKSERPGSCFPIAEASFFSSTVIYRGPQQDKAKLNEIPANNKNSPPLPSARPAVPTPAVTPTAVTPTRSPDKLDAPMITDHHRPQDHDHFPSDMLRLQDHIIDQDNFGASVNLLEFPHFVGGALCSLAERCVAVESAQALLTTISKTGAQLPASLQQLLLEFEQEQKPLLVELRQIILHNVTRDLLYSQSPTAVSGSASTNITSFILPLDRLAQQLAQQPESTNKPFYIERLKTQLQDLHRQVACCGGGCIPALSQILLWQWVEYHLVVCLTDVMARCKDLSLLDSFEELQCLVLGFLDELCQNAGVSMTATQGGRGGGPPSEGGGGPSGKNSSVLVEGNSCVEEGDQHQQHAMRTVSADVTGIADLRSPMPTRWSFLKDYVAAWSTLGPADVVEWCKTRPLYPMELLVNLLLYLQPANPSVGELQLHLCSMAKAELERYM